MKSEETMLVRYERPTAHVARIVLNRPEVKNAQSKAMLYALNDAFDVAAQDAEVRVIIVGAAGDHFSSGHDLKDKGVMADFRPVSCWGGFTKPGAEGHMALEEELFVNMCWRWRNIPKPTIAEVHGKVIGGGLMLVWPCDLVVASSDATFSDPVVAFGLNGHEFFVHPWELGHRLAKQMLFTGEAITASKAERIGMVNIVVEREDLQRTTLELAERISQRPRWA